MDFTKAEESKEFLLRTKPNGSQLDIKNTHFDCILKWLFFIDLHLNLPPFRTDPFMTPLLRGEELENAVTVAVAKKQPFQMERGRLVRELLEFRL